MSRDEHDNWGMSPDVGLFLFIFLPIFVGFPIITSVFNARVTGDTSFFSFALLLGGTGALLLLLARIPLYRERRFFTLGPKLLTGIYRKLYYTAYVFILSSISLLVLLLLAMR